MSNKIGLIKPGCRVYQITIPGYEDTNGEGFDGVIWAVLDFDEASMVEKQLESIDDCSLIRIPMSPQDAGIDFDLRRPGQKEALMDRLKTEQDHHSGLTASTVGDRVRGN